MNNFRSGQVLFRFGEGFRVVQVRSVRLYALRALRTGECTVHEEKALQDEARAGALSSGARARRQLLASVLLGIPHSPVAVPHTRPWNEAIRRLEYIQQLVVAGAFDLPWCALWAAVVRISWERGDNSVPHASTVRRWRAQHVEARRFSESLLGRQERSERMGVSPARQLAKKPDLRVVR